MTASKPNVSRAPVARRLISISSFSTVLDAARADDYLPWQTDEVHRGELRPGPLVQIVVKHAESGIMEAFVKRLSRLVRCCITGFQVDEANRKRRDTVRPYDPIVVVARLDHRADEP